MKRLPLKLLGLGLLGLLGVTLAAMPLVKTWKDAEAATPRAAPLESEQAPRIRLSESGAVAVPPDVATSLGLRTAPVKPASGRPLPPLAGSLALDPGNLAHVHSRFPGEVVEVGTLRDPESPAGVPRPVRYGDRVDKDQLLAVVWSKDLGEKKSELVDALSRLRLDRETQQRLEELLAKGSISERSVREAQQRVESDLVAVARVERTLLSWRLSQAEIETIRKEAERLHQQLHEGKRPANTLVKDWARVEVRAPIAGTILEKNVALGDIVDTSTDLFKVADLARLCVWAHIYEEDLPALLALSRPIAWTIRLKSDPRAPPVHGTIRKIGDIIDPTQHTALIEGEVDNRRGALRVGQFITATIDLPPLPGSVEIPTSALVEDGVDSIVFVQVEAQEPRYERRRVQVLRRYHDVVHVQSQPDGNIKPARQGLAVGEAVVCSGAVQLNAALDDLELTAKSAK